MKVVAGQIKQKCKEGFWDLLNNAHTASFYPATLFPFRKEFEKEREEKRRGKGNIIACCSIKVKLLYTYQRRRKHKDDPACLPACLSKLPFLPFFLSLFFPLFPLYCLIPTVATEERERARLFFFQSLAFAGEAALEREVLII